MKKVRLFKTKLGLSAAMLVLASVRFFREYATLPAGYDGAGNLMTNTRTFTYNIIENVSDATSPLVSLILPALIVLTIIMTLFTAVSAENEKALRISNIVFALSIVVFVVFLVIATTVSRTY